MNFTAYPLFRRVQVPSALLIALLQRTPVVRIATAVEESPAFSSIGTVLKSAAAAVAALGACDTVAGASSTISISGGDQGGATLAATSGKAISTVAFFVSGSENVPSSWGVDDVKEIPPGLSFSGLTSTSSHRVVNVVNGAAVLTGTPTTPGTYAMGLTAYESNDGGGSAVAASFTVVVSANANAPNFTTQPQSQTVNAGLSVTFTAEASNSPTYQWQKNSAPISGATAASYTIASAQLSDGGNYAVVATNGSGGTTSATATLTVVNPSAPPVFSTQPLSQTVPAGTNLSLTVAASTSPTFQWRKNGVNVADGGHLSGTTTATLLFTGAQSPDAGIYTAVATNAAGSTISNPATVAVAAGPVITALPVSLTVATGSTAVFSVTASGTPAPTYQWLYNGGVINGATSAQLVIPNASAGNVGSYACTVSNFVGSVTSLSATLNPVPTADPGRLVNLSVLSIVQNSLTMGFVVGGGGVSGSENLLIRATGPALAQAPFNVPGVMIDPTLTVVRQSGSVTLATNAGWGTPLNNRNQVTAADAAVGAFALNDPSSLDSALVTTLPVSVGGYTATVASKTGGSGYALTEVYDATAAGTYTLATPRLVNLSCLTQITAGGALTVGFVVGGSTAKTVLVRVSGPTLAAAPFNIGGTMTDPKLTVEPLSSATTILAANAGWGGDAQIASVASGVGAFAFSNATSKDSAALITLAAGTPYTVQVSSASGGGGLVLVEIYEVP